MCKVEEETQTETWVLIKNRADRGFNSSICLSYFASQESFTLLHPHLTYQYSSP